jgi:hypothetical protein
MPVDIVTFFVDSKKEKRKKLYDVIYRKYENYVTVNYAVIYRKFRSVNYGVQH